MRIQANKSLTIPSRSGATTRTWILQTVFIATLASLLRGTTVWASPLPSISAHLIFDANDPIPASNYNYARSVNLGPRQPTEDAKSSSLWSKLMENGARLQKTVTDQKTKLLDQGAMATETFIGFTYARPEIGQDRRGKFTHVTKLTFANPAWDLVSNGIYLLPELELPEQNPNNEYWSCKVYAKRTKIDEMKSHMIYEEREPLSYEDSETPPPPYSPEPKNYPNPIVFFQNEKFPNIVAMRIPKMETYIEEWDLAANCYETSKGLTSLKAPWNKWSTSIQGLPQDVKLVT
ncbi:hypothetical protein F5050DRAFT_1810084 [Lentinula boryana]|uniref:Uncharacterized protein n=1 Tax=Lentinula boryana TaxID=40481 RepID=A0ABQ8Q604_9AGAR|nr:hypothetical protein F5050DRAFT_1810084 [Lentinula boryana]